MCHDDDSHPPASLPRLGGSSGKDIVLTADDGTKILAYIAEPEVPKPQGTQVVVFPDARGISDFYKELTLRFAEIGIRAITLDFFGRTTSLDQVRGEDFNFRSYVMDLKARELLIDLKAALEYLHPTEGKPTFVTGFCLGGSVSLLAATMQWDRKYSVRGVMPFYPPLKREGIFGLPSFLDHLSKGFYLPVLGSFGGADEHIPVQHVDELRAMLREKEVYYEIKVYEGAPHSFFDRKNEFANASKDSWNRIGAFVEKFGDPY